MTNKSGSSTVSNCSLLRRLIGCTSAFLTTACMASLLLAPTQAQAAGSPNIVIAEAYGGGGNTGATYKNDFITLFNRGTAPVNITGWSVQYASATGSSWQKTTLSGTIPPGGYYLVQQAAGTGGTVDLPTPDATGTIPMGGQNFKVALCNSDVPLNSTCATGENVVDFVGVGSATCAEGAATPAASNTTSVQRVSDGCQDNDNNASDFVVAAPNPRNSASPLNNCPAGEVPPTITAQPQSQNRIVGESVTFSVEVSGTAPFTYQWYKGVSPLTDNGNLFGATSNVLAITNLTLANSGDYKVIVNNATALPAESSPATLTVASLPPEIVSQPLSQTVFEGASAAFRVAVYGTPPFTYQWKKDGANLSDGGQYSGTTTDALLIQNVGSGNLGNYSVVVTGGAGTGSTTSDAVELLLASGTGVLARWDFNLRGLDSTNPPPSFGDASAGASPVGQFIETFIAQPGSPFDPIGMILGSTNYYWGTAEYPQATSGSKTTGVRFDVSTAGKKNVSISYGQRSTQTASKYTRLQYTTNGTDFINYPFSSTAMQVNSFEERSFDLSGFPGVANNPNFGFRVVSEFQNTATYGMSNTASYAGAAAAYNPSGTLSYDMVTVNAEEDAGPAAPTLLPIAHQYVPYGSAAPEIQFSLSSGTAASVELFFGNQDVASGSGVTAGSGGTLYITGMNEGETPVIVKVMDANGNYASGSFLFTVTPTEPPPLIAQLPHTNTLVNTSVTIPFTVTDIYTPPTQLKTGKSSLNPALVPDSGIVISGTGNDRTVTITPAADAIGVAPIILSVTNNFGKVATSGFTVMVRPSASIILLDSFDYADGGLIDSSLGLWVHHSGNTLGELDVLNGAASIKQSESEDIHIPLIGAPYSTNVDTTLYSSFVVNFTALPSEPGAYFAHLKDSTTGGFVTRVFATTTNASAGAYRLAVANAGSTFTDFPMDLQLHTDYTVVTRTRLTNSSSTIWINPTSEASQSVTASDTLRPTDVLSFALRQAAGEGVLTLDNLKVGLSMADVIAIAPDSIPLNIQRNGDGSVTLTWNDPAFMLQETTALGAGWTTLESATSGYTVTPSGNKFYRLILP